MAGRRKTGARAASLVQADRGCPCPTDGIIELVGKRWTLCIIARLGQLPSVRFNDLYASLPGISPRTLSDTLKDLDRHGIVSRQVFAEVPPRVQYDLTAKGKGLVAAMRPLMEWTQAHEGPCCVPLKK